MPKKLILDPKYLAKEYPKLLKKIFEIMDIEEKLSIEVSNLLHQGGEMAKNGVTRETLERYISLLK